MKIVSADEMRGLDEQAIASGVSALELMERAGRGVAEIIGRDFARPTSRVGVLIGSGNNGGDGLVAARVLREGGRDVALFLTSPRDALSPAAQQNYDRILPLSPAIFFIHDAASLSATLPQLQQCDLIVDALFGVGLSRPIVGWMAACIAGVNALQKSIVAIDIPSGLDATTGEPLGISINAQATITLGLPKRGLFCGKGPELSGRIQVVDIGLPHQAIAALDVTWEMITPDLFAPLLAPRKMTAHKGDFGHVVVFAGSGGKLGAGFLTSLGVLRAGGGLVTYALPASSFEKFDARYPEIMGESIPDAGSGAFHSMGLRRAQELLSAKQAVVCGPAIGTASETARFVKEFMTSCRVPLVLDADALNCLAATPHVLKRVSAPVVITPHPGEMARLIGKRTEEVQADRITIASSFAAEQGVHVVLKGAGTVIATPDQKIFINPTGNPGMATAGMGDLLAGIIAGFMAQHQADLLESLLAAVYLHGLAGDRRAEKGEVGIVASDLLAELPKAMHETRKALAI